jgi:hypothetical protein
MNLSQGSWSPGWDMTKVNPKYYSVDNLDNHHHYISMLGTVDYDMV